MNDHERMVSEQTVSVSRRLIPGLLSVVLLLVFIAFMIGYFLGVKYTTDEFVTQIRQETLADQLLVSSVGSANSVCTPEQESGTQSVVQETARPCAETATSLSTILPTIARIENMPVETSSGAAKIAQPSITRYSAELIGFGTKSAAEEFIKRVAGYNTIPLELKERQSKTARGKVIKWYQVVTGKYEQKQDLQKVLDTLIKKERLQDIKIVAFAPGAKDIA